MPQENPNQAGPTNLTLANRLRGLKTWNCSCGRAVIFLWMLAILSGGLNRCAGQSVLAITNVTLIDATGAPAKPNATVLISAGRITDIGDAAVIQVPSGAVVVDATGKFLIRGLWDMHVHWYDRDYLSIFIANGITGIRLAKRRRKSLEPGQPDPQGSLP